MSESTVARWARTGRVTSRREAVGRHRRLVPLDDVLRLARANGRRSAPAPHEAAVVDLATPATAQVLRAKLADAQAELDAVRADAARTEAERIRLARRVAELESWFESRAEFEEAEQLQLGRMLAARASDRAERQRVLVSLRLTLLAVYLAGAGALAWMVLSERL